MYPEYLYYFSKIKVMKNGKILTFTHNYLVHVSGCNINIYNHSAFT
jgi:hypothetical protein